MTDHRITFDPLLTPNPTADHLWSKLPRELADLFRPRIADAASEVLREISLALPVYDQPVVAYGVQQAIEQFVDRLADPEAPRADRRALFRELGRRELMEGRNLDVLQSAYRIGARVAWRRMSRTAERAHVPIPTLCLLAEAIFAYIDELSSLSIEGYATAQAREVGSLERRRRRLLKLILAPSTMASIAAAASAARWAVPERVYAVALEPIGETRQPLHVHRDFLVDLESNTPCLVVSEVDRIADEFAGWRAAVGPLVPIADTARSLGWARDALEMVRRGVLPDVPVTWCASHLADLWLCRDPVPGRWLAEIVLRPLADLPAPQRERLSETLSAWLRTRGNVVEVAALLEVHPQTVRNRMHQLARLFGDRLADPEDRFEMEIALRATSG